MLSLNVSLHEKYGLTIAFFESKITTRMLSDVFDLIVLPDRVRVVGVESPL